MDETTPPLVTWDADALAAAGEKTKSLHALFANQLFVQPDGLHLRISLGERVGGEAQFHSSFVIPNGDALQFGQLLVSMAEAAINQQVEGVKQAFAAHTEEAPNGD